MGISDPAGYSEAAAHIFTWLADKVLGGAKKALGVKRLFPSSVWLHWQGYELIE